MLEDLIAILIFLIIFVAILFVPILVFRRFFINIIKTAVKEVYYDLFSSSESVRGRSYKEWKN